MSSTFDTLQMALLWLSDTRPDAQRKDVLHYMSEIVDELHTHSHENKDSLNHIAGKSTRLLQTALRHDDDETREMWLNLKERG